MASTEVEQTFTKYAQVGWGSKLLLGAAAAIGIGGGSKIVEELVEYVRERSTAAKSPEYYAKMLEAHPELKKEDLKVVARYWSSLYHFAPFMAQDPLAAGAFIRQSIARGLPSEFGGPAPDTYLTLADINKKSLEARPGTGISREFGGDATKSFTSGVIKGLVDPKNL